MPTFLESISELRRSIFALFYTTGAAEYPYSTFGSCFLIKLDCGVFAVTLKHVVQGASARDIFFVRPW